MIIYCLEDDHASRELMVYTLSTSGFQAEGFSRAAEFRAALERQKPDLILLDIMLPDEDGISVLKSLRAHPLTAHIPVIMETARGSEYDKVIGLDLGADDYLAKPFGMMELVSRVKAVLRRSAQSREEETVLRLGGVVLNAQNHTVTVKGEPVELTLKEFAILELLLANPGKVFSREALLIAVWDTDFAGETRTVDVHIGTLRNKLGLPDLIRTVRGVGYKVEADQPDR